MICDWSGTAFQAKHHKTLILEGHTDVVTEGDPKTWSYPPFEARLVDGKIYGRGSADMKAGLAAAIIATEAVRKVAPDLAGRIRLAIVSDEEGMMLGIKHFIAQGWADGVAGAIICEPEENEICLFQKGAMRVHCLAQGVMSHGAMPYAGANPIPLLAAFIAEVRDLEKHEQKRLGEHPYLGLPWFTPTILSAPYQGEAQLNVMPASAYMSLDIRTIPGQDHAEILAELSARAAKLCQADSRLKLELDCFESRPWTQTPQDDPLVKAMESVYEPILGQKPRYGGVPGATDGTFLHALKGIPLVTLGPGDRQIPHQKDEWVGVNDLIASAKLYAAAAVEFLSS
ncbi:MAG: M20 family metallopeptidase [Deinococcales bacterium]